MLSDLTLGEYNKGKREANIMLFKKNHLQKGKKMTEVKKNNLQTGEKRDQDIQMQVPVRKISEREIAMGYMLW